METPRPERLQEMPSQSRAFEPITIDSLPERLDFVESSSMVKDRELIVQAARSGKLRKIKKLEKDYDKYAYKTIELHKALRSSVALGHLVAKANIWREAGLYDREVLALSEVLQRERSGDASKPRTQITLLLEEALATAQKSAEA